MSRARGWDPIAGELADYFRTAESVNGLASSWAPLVGIAMGGAVTSTDPESRIIDGRFALGAWKTSIGKHRVIRRALLLLPRGCPSGLDILWAAHGPVPWNRVLDEGLGTGKAEKVSEHLDLRLLGVALLTPEVRAASMTWSGPEPAKAGDHRSADLAWRAPGGWLVDLVLTAKSRSKSVPEAKRSHAVATLSEIGRSAAMLLRGAEDAYREARGALPAELPPEPKAPRRSRRLDGLEHLEFMGDRKR